MCACMHVPVCVSGGQKYVIKCVPIRKKKKAYVQEGMQTKQKREIHLQGNNKKVVRG